MSTAAVFNSFFLNTPGGHIVVGVVLKFGASIKTNNDFKHCSVLSSMFRMGPDYPSTR